jgi:predicted alpha/beta-fold hydrolase
MKQHAEVLFSRKAMKKYDLDPDKIYASTSLHDLDELYSRRRAGFSSVSEYYTWCSSAGQIDNVSWLLIIYV